MKSFLLPLSPILIRLISIALASTLCTLCIAFAFDLRSNTHHSNFVGLRADMIQSPEAEERRGARVAFLGNSILYYNDTPRLMVNLGRGGPGGRVGRQDSCLRGGTDLAQLWALGNGMRHPTRFATDAAGVEGDGDEKGPKDVGSPNVRALLGDGRKWDFAVFNDHTQGPARPASRRATQAVLVEKYLPLIRESGATPVIVETAAYRLPGIKKSQDLGNTHKFQGSVREGVLSYVRALGSGLPESQGPRMAPVGSAYLYVHDDNRGLWEGLFDPFDDFHPSPSGTFLQGCVLHRVMFGSSPPLPRTEGEIANLWSNARVMHHPKTGKKRRLPTVVEAEYLWDVANRICN